MNVLIVCSGNSKKVSAFITEQVSSLKKKGIKADYFLIKGKLSGYLKSVFMVRKLLKNSKYNIVHAHFGLSGLVAVQQRICPVVISFIGEINFPILRMISKISIRFSTFNIFVSEELRRKVAVVKRFAIIPYGVNLKTFRPLNKIECRDALNLPLDKKIVLFSSTFDRDEKNYPLAKKVIESIDGLILLELSKGYKRNEINLLLNACDLLLLTSTKEGSPQVIKEAMACNCPIVSTNVGDVKDVIDGTKGCYITTFDPIDVADKIKLAFAFNKKTDGREKIKHLDNNIIAEKVISVYNKILFN
jgi:glycosyltransferase involved in cell wall biosynthesis